MKECSVIYPPQINLARLPTPLHPLARLSANLGVELFMKRDDLTGSALSGNKIRKLEFVLADAVAQKADTVLTCGGAQSNHCRATALAAIKAGLRSLLILRTPDPGNPPPMDGNILLDGDDAVHVTDFGLALDASRGELPGVRKASVLNIKSIKFSAMAKYCLSPFKAFAMAKVMAVSALQSDLNQ